MRLDFFASAAAVITAEGQNSFGESWQQSRAAFKPAVQTAE